MTDEAYRLEESVLFNRYGILGYSDDSVDTVPNPGGCTYDNDPDISETSVLK